MRGLLVTVLAVAALAGAALVPASSASSGAVKLSLVPLSKAELGAAAHSLPLAQDSGYDTNARSASNSTGGVTAERLKRLGRVTGYLLDYGTPFGDGAGAYELQTEVEQYRSASAAAAGLAFWRKQVTNVSLARKLGFKISVRKVSPSGASGPHWAYLATTRLPGTTPVYEVQEQLLDGSYLLDLAASAGSAARAEKLIPGLAGKLQSRLRLALAGGLHGSPVPLPRPRKAGPPAKGPKPAALTLQPSDLSGKATVVHDAYVSPKETIDDTALSAYALLMEPAGPYLQLAQELVVTGSVLESEYYAAFASALLTTGSGAGGKATVTPVDTTGIGDRAHAALLAVSAGGQSVYEALVVLTRDKVIDLVVVADTSPIAASDVQSLARAAASRLDSGLGG